jgi:hypothetical protein
VPVPQIARCLLLTALAAGAAAGCLDPDVIEHSSGAGWEGGPEIYRRWPAGPPPDPAFFPIAVWLQQPANAPAYKALGVNVLLGLWQGPTEQQLADVKTAGVSTVCSQNDVGLARAGTSSVIAWQHENDDPDNAQKLPSGDYGPCLPPETVRATYQAMTGKDATRPVFLQFGQGVAGDLWIGRGSACSGRLDLYPEYIKGADITSFHVYPLNSDDAAVKGKLWLFATGVDRLRAWSHYTKPVWPVVEATGYDDPTRTPTPTQIKAEVWMSLVHGAMGIIYFVHVFKPEPIEAGLLANSTNSAAVAAINQQIHELAPVLNTAPLPDAATVTSSDPRVPIDFVVKRQGGATYLFAVAMRDGQVTANVTLRPSPGAATAEVLGEGRRIPVVDGKFSDGFTGYGVHLYRIGP